MKQQPDDQNSVLFLPAALGGDSDDEYGRWRRHSEAFRYSPQ